MAMWDLPDELPVVDENTVERLRALMADVSEDGEDLARDLLETFRTDVERRLATFDACLARGERDDAVEAAHALKGASATVGAPRVSRLCALVEQALRSEVPMEGARERIEREAGDALRALERALLGARAGAARDD